MVYAFHSRPGRGGVSDVDDCEAIVSHVMDFENPDVPHVPDWRTVALADVTPNPGEEAVWFDVWCEVCGQSGSFILLIDDRGEVAWV